MSHPVLVGIVCFVIGVVAIGWPVFRNDGFPLDDSWIHQVVGRNAARFGTPGFTPGVASSGSSSTLWPWLIALNYRLASSIEPPVYLFILNVFFLAAALFCLYAAARRDQLRVTETIALVALPVLYGNVVWLLAIGMEHVLFVAALFLAAHFLLSGNDAARHANTLIAGVLFSIGIATRPEALALLPCYLLAAALLGRRRNELILFLVPCSAAISLVILNNYLTSHSILPVTLSGRKWLYFGEGNPTRAGLAFALARGTIRHVTESITGFDIHNFWPAAVVLFAAIIAGVRRLFRLRAFHTLFLVGLAAANFATYGLFLPSLGHGMRYQAMSLVFVFPLIALGLLEIARSITHRLGTTQRVARYCNVAVMLASFALAFHTLYNWAQITDAGIRHINGTHVRMGKWLAANLPENATVATFDIGAIGYFSNRKIADLGGLVDPAFIPYLYSNRSADYLRQKNVGWLVLPMDVPEAAPATAGSCQGLASGLNLCDGARLARQQVIAFYTSKDTWLKGFLATGHALDGQALYQLSWR